MKEHIILYLASLPDYVPCCSGPYVHGPWSESVPFPFRGNPCNTYNKKRS